jgi:acetyltransferase
MAAVTIRRVAGNSDAPRDGLCALLVDCVDNGASVGFLAPLGHGTALKYWTKVIRALDDGLLLWIAEEGGELVGSVQVDPCMKENGLHRGELQKLLVLKSHRGRGIAKRLLDTAEAYASAQGRRLLVLDTQSGSVAETVYRRLGWSRGGEIPDYAVTPSGELHPTTYYFKRITGA